MKNKSVTGLKTKHCAEHEDSGDKTETSFVGTESIVSAVLGLLAW